MLIISENNLRGEEDILSSVSHYHAQTQAGVGIGQDLTTVEEICCIE